MIELLRECRDAFGNIHTYAHKTDFVLKESSDMLNRLDAALAGKDAAHPHTDQCGFDRNGSHSAGHYVCMCGWEDKSAGAAPGLPEEPIVVHVDDDMGGALLVGKHAYDTLRTLYLRAVKERDTWKKEYDALWEETRLFSEDNS